MTENNKIFEQFNSACATGEDGKQTVKCENALEFAKKNNIPPKVIAKHCNQNNIKITGCQLGCFK